MRFTGSTIRTLPSGLLRALFHDETGNIVGVKIEGDLQKLGEIFAVRS